MESETNGVGASEQDSSKYRLGSPFIPLRDWFAGMALQGLLANVERSEQNTALMATECYRYADAMLVERAK